ncbi:hypothetical protein QBC45DRAFT_434594 [Copromyces sp. CBS 386.78]|nr:hypothetical protein QBC45DRAFT_434594 [Copromyces sp. CBS 386.78]
MAATNTMSDEKKAAELLAEFLSADSLYAPSKSWGSETKAIIQVFALKRSSVMLWMTYPLTVEGLKEAVEKLDDSDSHRHASAERKRRRADSSDDEHEADEPNVLPEGAPTSYSRKRRRTDTVEAKEPDYRIAIPKGKRPVFKWVSKLKVYGGGPYTVRAVRKQLQDQPDSFEVTLEDPATVKIKFCHPPRKGFDHSRQNNLNDNLDAEPADTA